MQDGYTSNGSFMTEMFPAWEMELGQSTEVRDALPASHTPRIFQSAFDRHKKNPERPTPPGFASLSPQLVGSIIPAAGSGDGDRRSGLDFRIAPQIRSQFQ